MYVYMHIAVYICLCIESALFDTWVLLKRLLEVENISAEIKMRLF